MGHCLIFLSNLIINWLAFWVGRTSQPLLKRHSVNKMWYIVSIQKCSMQLMRFLGWHFGVLEFPWRWKECQKNQWRSSRRRKMKEWLAEQQRVKWRSVEGSGGGTTTRRNTLTPRVSEIVYDTKPGHHTESVAPRLGTDGRDEYFIHQRLKLTEMAPVQCCVHVSFLYWVFA